MGKAMSTAMCPIILPVYTKDLGTREQELLPVALYRHVPAKKGASFLTVFSWTGIGHIEAYAPWWHAGAWHARVDS